MPEWPRSPAPSSRTAPAPLSPRVEAFRAQFASTEPAPSNTFAGWRKAQRAGVLMSWTLTLVFLSPGLLCFLLQAPLGLSIGIEALGLAINAWLRRNRRQRLSAIVDWEDPNGA